MNKEKEEVKIFDINTELPDELKFLDKDIADEFRGKNYFIGTPTLVQLARRVDELVKELKRKDYEY